MSSEGREARRQLWSRQRAAIVIVSAQAPPCPSASPGVCPVPVRGITANLEAAYGLIIRRPHAPRRKVVVEGAAVTSAPRPSARGSAACSSCPAPGPAAGPCR
eukprot:CAMPEP_0206005214 /NCGR_PEP_ID=MMETSP1464-20131121/4444_1 /ASSEMBLY_ACC=CAM_ASM_001124 /TAXON_ID=119497 /ORGANISM="Exanthemachrysis gayraliae, Strain RCC1523" /LENGTH=102 /DNA_ID=CAMNT_0053378641 /DNA_START=54 /DNA_END=357 /DNA_ORIENTATION=+